MKQIYLAGGCFWGMQAYFDNIVGVKATQVGYANGDIKNPTYELVCKQTTGFAETIRVEYDESVVNLAFLLNMYFKVIDPTTLNRQGNDKGSQYRSGIYYVDEDDKNVISKALLDLQKETSGKVVVENLPLKNYYPAEQYHQDYLKYNPFGYCHISKEKIEEAKHAKMNIYQKKDINQLASSLTQMQYKVTQLNATEPAFDNEFHDHYEKGIYVDITTGEPLFISSDKFESGCGWPSFSKPINRSMIKENRDQSHGMERIEVRSKIADSHLGHVFTDGPIDKGGLRYCINSAALRFIPLADMKEAGYQEYIEYIKKD